MRDVEIHLSAYAIVILLTDIYSCIDVCGTDPRRTKTIVANVCLVEAEVE